MSMSINFKTMVQKSYVRFLCINTDDFDADTVKYFQRSCTDLQTIRTITNGNSNELIE